MDRPSAAAEAALYRYRFGSAEFDEARFELRVGGLAVDLERRPLEVLAHLLHCAGELVTRDALFDGVWAGRPTVDNVLGNAVSKLRSALGAYNASLLVTVPRIGYRLTGPVERVAVGRRLSSGLKLKAAEAVPGREHFILDLQLGQSSGSEVWLAKQPKSGELRVYKFSPDGERLASLKREVTLYRLLIESLGDSEDYARILDWNFEEPPYFLECEYGGPNLYQWAEQPEHLAALDQQQRIDLFLQIADAVAAAHGLGILHKDLKPANILVAPRDGGGWHLRVADFGSARLLEPERLAELGISQLGLTVTQPVNATSSSGTPLYLAPELIAGQPPTTQTDVYALGLILYQIVVGDLKKPMAPGWEANIADALLREDIAAAMDGNPVRRLMSVAELTDRLRKRSERADIQHRVSLAEQRAETAERDRRKLRAARPWWFAAILVLAIALGVSVWLPRGAVPLTETRDPRKELASFGLPWTRQAFHNALREGDARSVQLFLQGGMSLQEPGRNEIAHLFYALNTSREMQKVLVEYRRQIDDGACLLPSIKEFHSALDTDRGAPDAFAKICNRPAVTLAMRGMFEMADQDFRQTVRYNSTLEATRKQCLERLATDWPLEKVRGTISMDTLIPSTFTIDAPEKHLMHRIAKAIFVPTLDGFGNKKPLETTYAESLVPSCHAFYAVGRSPVDEAQLGLMRSLLDRM